MYARAVKRFECQIGSNYITKQQFHEISENLRYRGFSKFAVQLLDLDCKIRYIHVLIKQSNFKVAFKNLGELFEDLKKVEIDGNAEMSELLYMWAHYCELCNFLDRLIEEDIDVMIDCGKYGKVAGLILT